MSPVEQFLRRTPLFEGVEDHDLVALAASVRTQTYGRGELLARPAYPARTISFVEQGGVRLFRLTAEGRQLTVGTRRAGDYFWQISADATGVPRSWIEALADGTVVHRFPRVRFDALLARHPAVAMALIEQLSSYLGEAYDRLEDAALRPPDVQLAHTLARLSGGEQLVVTATHEEIAACLGTTRECVTKLLGQLRASKLVACQRRRQRILLLEPRRLGAL